MEGGGGKGSLYLNPFFLDWSCALAGVWYVAPLGEGRGQFRLDSKGLPLPPLLL